MNEVPDHTKAFTQTVTFTATGDLTPEQRLLLHRLISNLQGLTLYAGHYENALFGTYARWIRADLDELESQILRPKPDKGRLNSLWDVHPLVGDEDAEGGGQPPKRKSAGKEKK